MNPKFADVITALQKLENAKRHDKPAQIELCRANLWLSYAHADFVIFRCNCVRNILGEDDNLAKLSDPFYVTFKELQSSNDVVNCEFCDQPCDRLLLSGEWQTQEERNRDNQTRYEAVSG